MFKNAKHAVENLKTTRLIMTKVEQLEDAKQPVVFSIDVTCPLTDKQLEAMQKDFKANNLSITQTHILNSAVIKTKENPYYRIDVTDKIANCNTCNKLCKKLSCARCKNVVYCSKECQLDDWSIHKTKCIPLVL
jgi:hypothetical protein